MEILEIMKVPYYKKGKGIHIKKKNRGKFTEYCGGEVTNECIQKAKKSKNPTLRKRATFAQNARGWSKKHQVGGAIAKFQNPAGGIQLKGKPRSVGFMQKLKEWWHNYPEDYSGGMCALDSKGNPTSECAKYSNDVLRSKGYQSTGDAWTRIPFSGAKVLYSGYDKKLPETYDNETYTQYINEAADRFAEKVDTTKLRDYDIVGMTSLGSPSQEKAYNTGKKHGRLNTHTGHIRVGKDGTHYVVHNVHNNLYQHKLADLLGSNNVFSVIEAARPRK